MSQDNPNRIEVETYDIRLEKDWRAALAEVLKQTAVEAKAQELFPTIHIYCTREPRTHKPMDPPGLYLCMHDYFAGSEEEIEANKEQFVTQVRAISISGRAIATVSILETWTTINAVNPDGSVPPHPPPSQDPRRVEQIVIYANHRVFGVSAHEAGISRESDGSRVIGPWNEMTNVRLSGRMFDFMIQEPTTDEQRQIFELAENSARIYLNHLPPNVEYRTPPERPKS